MKEEYCEQKELQSCENAFLEDSLVGKTKGISLMQTMGVTANLSKKNHAEKYLFAKIQEFKNKKVKAVFTFDSMSWNHHRGFRTYSTDTELFILFENDKCLCFDYRFIDGLKVKCMEFTKKDYESVLIKDYFNIKTDISDLHAENIIRSERIELEYDTIEKVELKPITHGYAKWKAGGINYVKPTTDTFGEIRFKMRNGKDIVICPDDAEMGGYVCFWSEDAVEFIER